MLAEAKGIAAELTEQRRKAAKQLEGEIVRELSELDMDKVKMRVAVRTGTKLSAHGCDTVTFEISVNPVSRKSRSPRCLRGELSRIMLALKNVLTAGEDVGMLIFDEIDTGVSGHAAQQIGRKLSAIAKRSRHCALPICRRLPPWATITCAFPNPCGTAAATPMSARWTEHTA